MKWIVILTVGLALRVDAFTIQLLPVDVGGGGVGGSGMSESQFALLNEAAGTWQGLITGYQPGISLGGVSVSFFTSAYDGVGNTFAVAGPTAFDFQSGYFLATAGSMHFDNADIGALETAGTLRSVMEHEIAHVMGFGTLWTLNGLYVEGSGQYMGGAAVTAFAQEFSPGATFVPVELSGGSLTRDLHWDEVDGGLGLTGITDALGRDFGNETMTGWTGPNAELRFISGTTLAQFEDLGFTVIPEPSTGLLALGGMMGWVARRRRLGKEGAR